MISFLIKSAISMGILLGVYHLLLQREKMHRFNRFYLLFSLAFSLVLPLIIIPIYVEAEIIPEAMYSTQPDTNIVAPAENQINYLSMALWSIYGLVTSFLLLRFTWNILSFKRKVSSGEIVDIDNAKLVLVNENTLPYTFLNYIFVNKHDYEEKTIEDELFTHELTHVKQKHTLDILFIEILKVIFWFNPLLYLYGRSIRLNHEFLADENVVEETQNVISYQNILLQKTSGLTPVFASNLNFSLTKKRLLMMTKTTSRTKALLLQTAIVPILVTLLTLLCTEEVVAQNNSSKNLSRQDYKQSAQLKKNAGIVQDSVYNTSKLTKQPEYSDGGMKGFYSHVNSNFVIPKVKENMTARIYVSFVIEKDGSMSNIKVLRDPGHGLGDEAVRVLKTIDKKWTPGEMDGKIVRASYNLPITINIKN